MYAQVIRKAAFLAMAVAAVAYLSGSGAQSTRTVVDLRTGPVINSSEVSNLALALSVEFPTVGAAYRSGSYTPSQLYLGYWNPTTCYRYNGTSTSGYFQPNGATSTLYECNITGTGTGFSGNFLNFAATSSIDIFRYALTGGDRIIDESGTTGRTVLQRAVLPGGASGDPNPSFYGYASNFPTKSVAAGTTLSRMTPFTMASGTMYVKSCFEKIFFGNTDTGSCSAPGNNANLATTNTAGTTVTGTFQAKVLVCDSTEGPVRSDLCRQYPDGNYKPVGEVQKYSDKVRLAAFGYLLDQVNTRYGGVLRAPMKFVGPKEKSAAGVVSTNAAAEWSESSGVYVAKPLDGTDESGFTNSGVINYLNQFGRTGLYKRYDPVGELFYETIRYYQGLQPTADATTGMDTTMKNGYPVYTTWSDPMQTNCQRNYAMVIGDNNTHLDAYIPGSTISSQTRAAITGTGGLNANYWTRVIESFETNAASGQTTYTDSQGVTQNANGNPGATGLAAAVGPQAGNTNLATTLTGSDRASYLWSGVAYWANTQVIRSDRPQARVRTFVVDVDEGGNGTLVRNRSFYLSGKYGGFADAGPNQSGSTGEGNPFKTWSGGTLSASTSEWLATDGSTSPSGYFLASQPQRVIDAIRKIFSEAAKPSGSLAAGVQSGKGVSSSSVTATYYFSEMNPSNWTGDVVRADRYYNTTTAQLSAATEIWRAGKILTGYTSGTTTVAPVPVPADRRIYTATRLTSPTTNTSGGVTFTWANLDAAVQTSLRTDPATLTTQTVAVGQQRVDYLRGDRSNEGTFRGRSSLLGDIINSSMAFSGKPSASISDTGTSTLYSTFYNTYKNRTPTVFVGANDGMLHAFKAADSATASGNGQELFAYVPRAISLKLNQLTDPAYSKQPYVDGSIQTGEALIYKPAAGALGWATTLVAGMGGGAQGVFALDVTNPTSFSATDVLWEFTDQDDVDMGHIVGKPQIVKINVAGSAAATPSYKWFAAVSSGFNNYDPTDGRSNTDGRQYLFLLSLEKQPSTAWTLNTNYYKFLANDATFTSTTAATALSMPGFAFGTAGNALAAYAGDLQGNLWRVDLSGAASGWSSVAASRVFIAKSAANVLQPITVAPLVRRYTKGGYLITFGTGKFVEPVDMLTSSAAQQSLYTVWDVDGSTLVPRTTGSTNGLISRTVSVSAGSVTTSVSITGSSFYYGTGAGTYRGWYADFTSTMERLAVEMTYDPAGIAVANSSLPGGDPCSASGSGYTYVFNPNTGLSYQFVGTTGYTNYTGFQPKPTVTKLPPVITSKSELAGGTGVTGAGSKADTSGRRVCQLQSDISSRGSGIGKVQKNTVCGRVSWREITNF